jgi:hypothetical protein
VARVPDLEIVFATNMVSTWLLHNEKRKADSSDDDNDNDDNDNSDNESNEEDNYGPTPSAGIWAGSNKLQEQSEQMIVGGVNQCDDAGDEESDDESEEEGPPLPPTRKTHENTTNTANITSLFAVSHTHHRVAIYSYFIAQHPVIVPTCSLHPHHHLPRPWPLLLHSAVQWTSLVDIHPLPHSSISQLLQSKYNQLPFW